MTFNSYEFLMFIWIRYEKIYMSLLIKNIIANQDIDVVI